MPLQTMFLIMLGGGITCLVAALGVARCRWRDDVAPFSRRTGSLRVLARPERYAVAAAVPVVRALAILGGVLLAIAAVAVVRGILG